MNWLQMKVEDNLTAFFDALIKKRENWKWVTDEQKEKNFFIINRFMAKKYTGLSQLLNIKTIDKVAAMDCWFHFMENEPYPKWFWSKSQIEKESLSSGDKKILIGRLEIKESDLEWLLKLDPQFIKDELKYLKNKEKLN